MIKHCTILGTGSALPDRVVPSAELEALYGLEPGWIDRRCGVESRHIGTNDDSAHALGLRACINALDASRLDSYDIDTIIVSTSTPDLIAPSTACLIADGLGLTNVSAFDISSACAGWMYAIQVAKCMVETGTVNNVLVAGTEMMSRIVNWNEKETCVLFGDGAGAVILGCTDEAGVKSITTSSNGEKKDILFATNSIRGQTHGFSEPTLVLKDGQDVFLTSVNTMATALSEEMAANELNVEDIDWLVLHQANKRIIAAISKKIGVPESKVLTTIQTHGNTSSASIPLVLDHFARAGALKSNNTILLGAFGSGFSWATGVIKWS